MAAHHHHCAHTDVHTELCSALSRVATIMTCDRDRCERERQEHISSVANLTTRLDDLQRRYDAAQASIAAHSRVENALNEANHRIAQLTAQRDGLEADLEASREKNSVLKAKVDKTEKLLVGTAEEMETWKEKWVEAARDLVIAKQTVKAARKKMKRLCGLLKNDDDIPDTSSKGKKVNYKGPEQG
ncbi:hypothetical protein VNI00_010889 [Paramarasmius palmivorus]|uniref:Uncharacterized protein n=1 Tax=Paramarasmius palmivorus TaxID=297713 RepID=A0AAW0CDD7_9AGAR